MDVPAVGIDLGTTNTCVAVLKNNNIAIIQDDGGSRTFSSIVYISADETIIGNEAKRMVIENPGKTIYEIKRIIGRNYSDPVTQEFMQRCSYEIINRNERPMIKVEDKRQVKEYYPEQISALVLANAKKMAENYLGCQVTRAVVTVPAYFDNSQRQATKDAATIAGLKVVKLINEPTAAAIAYGWDNKSFVTRNILVYDLGGGTFDVTILQVDEHNYNVIATSGDTKLGGSDFDYNLETHLVKKFKLKYGTDMKENKYAMRRLRSRCEDIKKNLSFNLKTESELFSLHNGNDFCETVSRIEFEQLNYELFRKTINILDACMKDSGLSKSDITDVVLVGGSTRIPKVQKMLKEYFDGKPLMKCINPDEAVAFGAAIQASIMSGEKVDNPLNINISDVTSLSLGKSVVSGELSVVIKRNTKIPCKETKPYYTAFDDQTSVTKYIYQGERKLAKDNTLLGVFSIENLPKRPKGQVEFEDTFELDENGILTVDSQVVGTDLTGKITISMENNRLSKEEIKELIKEAEEKKEQDQKQIRINQAKYELESYAISSKLRTDENIYNLDDKTISTITDTCNEAINKMETIDDVFQLEELLIEIKNICEPLLQ